MSETEWKDQIQRLHRATRWWKIFALLSSSILIVLVLFTLGFGVLQWNRAQAQRDLAVQMEQEARAQREQHLEVAGQRDKANRDSEEARRSEKNARTEAEKAKKEEQQAKEEAQKLRQGQHANPPIGPAPRPKGTVDVPALGQTPKNVTAYDLALAYYGNDALGDEKYLGKLLRVTGRPGQVRRMISGAEGTVFYLLTIQAVSHEVGVPDPPQPLFAFKFGDASRKQLADLAKLTGSEEMIVEGRCEGKTPETGEAISFSNSRIIKIIPPER
jgi:hypothetical protein